MVTSKCEDSNYKWVIPASRWIRKILSGSTNGHYTSTIRSEIPHKLIVSTLASHIHLLQTSTRKKQLPDILVSISTFHKLNKAGRIKANKVQKHSNSQGRIVKEAIRNLKSGATRNPTYTYDNRGNLAVPGWKSSGYDNKVSIVRAHPLVVD